MLRTRTICPKCGKETDVLEDEDDLDEYREEIEYRRCSGHPITPVDRLLAAIFGKELPNEAE